MVTPGEEIRRRLQDRGWTQGDLAQIMDRPPQTVNQIIQGKKAITPDMAAALAAAFGTTPDLWMQLESQFRLSLVKVDTSPIEKRARLCDYAPVKEMIRRGWIAAAESVEEQERIVCQFFEIGSLDEVPRIVAAMRKSSPSTDLSPSQTAWCFRARHVAKSLPIGGFDEKRMGAMKRDLRILAAYPAEAQRIPTIMRENGIRFVVVEHLAGSKVDGAAFWLDEQSPTIAVSLRLDRMDNFWFTLMHECAHIDHHDAISIDAEMGHEERWRRSGIRSASNATPDPTILPTSTKWFGTLWSL